MREMTDCEITEKLFWGEKRSAPELEAGESCPVLIAKIHEMGERESQEDAFGISDVMSSELLCQKGVLAVLADGMGGLDYGAEVSTTVIVSMLKYFDKHEPEENANMELKHMLMYANEKVNRFLGTQQLGKGGSTLAAVMIRAGRFYWISVGDSRIYFYRQGVLKQINKTHNYFADLLKEVQKGTIKPEEAMNHPQRNALTSYIGAGEIAMTDQSEEGIPLHAGERILIVSDGVFKTVDDKELCDVMKLGLSECAMKMRQLIETRNKKNQDNYTALILEGKGND